MEAGAIFVNTVTCTATKTPYDNEMLHLNAHMFTLLGFEAHHEAIGLDYTKRQRGDLATRLACGLELTTNNTAALERFEEAIALLNPLASAVATA